MKTVHLGYILGLAMARPVWGLPDLQHFFSKGFPPQVLAEVGWDIHGVMKQARKIARVHEACELFCGHAGFCKGVQAAGGRTTAMDVLLSANHDLTTVGGMAAALLGVMSVVKGGTVWVGFPCNTFIWLTRRTSQRSSASPEGNVLRKDVQEANQMAWFVSKLLCLAAIRGVLFVIEQPASSLLFSLPAINWLQTVTQCSMVRGELGAWGHQMAKPSVFMYAGPFQEVLGRMMGPRQRKSGQRKKGYIISKVRKGENAGRRQVTGTAALAATAQYPSRFCAAMGKQVMAAVGRGTRLK